MLSRPDLTLSARTVIRPDSLICSLITIRAPPGSRIAWFGFPVTVTEIPSTLKLATREEPAKAGLPWLHHAVALDSSTVAAIEIPPRLTAAVATEAELSAPADVEVVFALRTVARASPLTCSEETGRNGHAQAKLVVLDA